MKNLWKRTLYRLPGLLRFLPIYFWEMTKSNYKVAVDALRWNPRFNPGFVEISVKGYDPIQRWEAASLITMTPGTLAVDEKENSDMMLIHCLYLDDPVQARAELETLIQQSLGKPDTHQP